MERRALSALRIGHEPVKRGFLYALIGSVGFSAVLAIFAIVSGDLDSWGDKALFSALTVAAASVCGLACGARLESAGDRALPLMGVTLATAAAAAVLLIIWAELDLDEHEMLWNTTGTLCVFAVAVAHLCLLSMAKLAARFEWSLVAAYIVILFVAALLTIMLWFDIGDEGMFRLLVVAVILDGAITTAIPIFHRLSRIGSAVPRDRPQNAVAIRRIGVERVKRGFLYALIGSVGASAFMAILAIVSGDFDNWDLRALLSASTIAARERLRARLRRLPGVRDAFEPCRWRASRSRSLLRRRSF